MNSEYVNLATRVSYARTGAPFPFTWEFGQYGYFSYVSGHDDDAAWEIKRYPVTCNEINNMDSAGEATIDVGDVDLWPASDFEWYSDVPVFTRWSVLNYSLVTDGCDSNGYCKAERSEEYRTHYYYERGIPLTTETKVAMQTSDGKLHYAPPLTLPASTGCNIKAVLSFQNGEFKWEIKPK